MCHVMRAHAGQKLQVNSATSSNYATNFLKNAKEGDDLTNEDD